jgi:hypothetical protein
MFPEIVTSSRLPSDENLTLVGNTPLAVGSATVFTKLNVVPS